MAAMFLFPPVQETENPWTEKVSAAVEKAERLGSVAALAEALDAAWRGDAWQTGLELAQRVREKHAGEEALGGLAARAFWRAGHIHAAERMAARIARDTRDRVALGVLIATHLARGESDAAERYASRLEPLSQTAVDLSRVIAARVEQNRLDGIAALLRKTQRLANAENGYPEIYIAEELDGLAEFFDVVGTEPLNQIARHGEAAMPALPVINLPGCMMTINGHGPYRILVDTGGSITLSIDEAVAEEIGLKSIVDASIRGVSGKSTSGQAVVDELKIGGIVCKRVMTRIFEVRKAVAYSCDGILGTGLFADGRMTLDFERGRLVVAPSSERAAAGNAVDLRIVSDAKLIAPVTVQGEVAAALLDSGADVVAVSPSRLKRIYPDRAVHTARPVGALGVGDESTPQISLGPGVDLELAGRTYKNVSGLGLDVLDTTLGPVVGVQTDILVGMAIFRDMKSCTVDFPRCKMWIDWLEQE
ncbi:MAG: aspartyl protease family protein [Planctomycetes bacterium]|nr:aspartyl protease family protein [Planctomycetota bacterium]